MSEIDRRTLIRSIIPGAVITAVGVTALASAGLSLTSTTAEALPVAKLNAAGPTNLVEEAQYIVVRGRRRRRRRWYRRRCYWRRGRRYC